ncbi:hypothetical protein FIU89_21775 (plasmid) [Roseovarius sp. THAF27]|uniref:helix-turn-helix transcriptional regulator n=1 Tax=unclassified Roseovarius TaxID=2614913 RepID=UPI0012682F4F|nr:MULTISPECIES: helix-turn-helix transcriptional regulator [unclassified Roseovarius]QFT83266.1 hypothetical protein FIU89_21775 [Roseovarius sp. THAF27]QFT99928.1 hypothetical protein FIU85_21590 [Roseovarius sp. THAF8]
MTHASGRYCEFADQLALSANVDMIYMGVYDTHGGFFLDHWSGYRNPAERGDQNEILSRLTRVMQKIDLRGQTRRPAASDAAPDPEEAVGVAAQHEFATAPFQIIVGKPTGHLYPLVAVQGWKTSGDKSPPDTFLSVALSFAAAQLRNIIGQKSPRTNRLIDTALRVLAVHFAVVDSTGTIECSANISNEWLARNGDFEIDKERLVARTHKVQDAFQKALDLATGPEAKPSIVSLRTESGPNRMVWISRLTEFSEPRALVILGRGEENPMVRDHLLKLSGLTASERRVAHHVLRGKSLDETAKATDLAVSTVRSYMKRILAKTSTRRQSEFVSHYQGELIRMAIAPSEGGNETPP